MPPENPAPTPSPTPSNAWPTHNWRNSPRIRERLLKVAGLRQRGLNQGQIGVRLRVSRSTISRDLRRLDLLWRQEHTHLANAERLRALAALRETEHLCWALIERHHKDADHLADVTSLARTLIATQREIRQLLADVPRPHRDDLWGHWRDTRLDRYVAYPDTNRPPATRVWAETHAPPDGPHAPTDYIGSIGIRPLHPDVQRRHRETADLLARLGLDSELDLIDLAERGELDARLQATESPNGAASPTAHP